MNSAQKWQRWSDEYQQACKARGMEQWQKRAKAIVKRYRDERADVQGDAEVTQGSRFNILWSNIQTLMPALLAKMPKAVVERRYLDKDDVGRTASVVLERALTYELDDGTYLSALKKAVLDRLLAGRGVVWIRYEPRFTAMPGKAQDIPEPGAQEATTDAPQEQVASESAVVDYIDWRDFMTSASRTWEEVWWVDKLVYMTRKELIARFGKEVGSKVPLDWTPAEQGSKAPGAADEADESAKRATVHETWDKRDRKVYWWAKEYKDGLLDERDDPLQLESFWPVPKPLFATLTNDSLVPIPDFIEYQDQAMELDDLTARITALTKAIKVAGVYDASQPELKRIFEEGFENELVGADNMAEFSAKAGANGMGHLWLLPIKDMAATLLQLYDARDRVKQVLYEVTGISDIVRGAASQGAKTATEQRIKGQFASMRLNDMQMDVARFARDTLRIMGEMIAEHFDPMTLFEIAGYEQYAKEQWPPEPAPPPPMPPQMGHNGGPPMESPPVTAMGGQPPAGPPPAVGSPGMAAPAGAPAGLTPPPMGMMAPQPSPEQVAQLKAATMFKQAIELLRNDRLRGFRIDIETDSLIEPDQQETQRARTELMGAISQFLPQAIEAGMQAPELKPLLARLMMFFLRGFKASRDIEAAFEQFIDDQTKEASKPKPPPPPSPEQIKAQAEQQRTAADMQMKQVEFQMQQQQAVEDAQRERDKAQFDMDMERERFALEREKLEMELAFKEREFTLKAQTQEHDAQLKAASMEHSANVKAESEERSAAMQAESMDRQAEADEHKHALSMEAAEAKAEQAKEPATEAPPKADPEPDKRIDDIMAMIKELSQRVSKGSKKVVHRNSDGLITHIETLG